MQPLEPRRLRVLLGGTLVKLGLARVQVVRRGVARGGIGLGMRGGHRGVPAGPVGACLRVDRPLIRSRGQRQLIALNGHPRER